MTACDRAAHAFRTVFDAEPDGLWCAPGRVNLIGEHVDYAGGLCLPMALSQVTAVAVRRRDDGRLRLHSEGFDPVDIDPGTGRVDGWGAYVAGVVWALDPPGFTGVDIAVVSEVPVGAGLSSSAALEAAVALALAELCGLPTDDAGRDALAAVCVCAENDYVGAPTGGMDQQIALRGRGGYALLLDCADGSVDHIPVDLARHGLTLLVVDTGTGHRLVDGRYGERRTAVEDAVSRLSVRSLRDLHAPEDVDSLDDPVLRRRARHVVTEIARVQDAVARLRAGDIRDLGPLLDASHRSLRDDFEVSCLELDTAVDAARSAGALGARMVGGGFGGSVIALCESSRVAQIEGAVTAAAGRHDLPRPRFLHAVPSPGARRC
ncbi:galactokinase [Rhodococcus chondri]|uniref:Galactokinase n=1 Tax=Rhodococcus chondri TaxID=3065941 RepID=A0ABU7JZW6_9NOCA|nr:galactokinase [Rhodococcus sp. CC-R104]MEE2035114.1 galactokinase [Rhodococcus sp. CC-R104]